MISKKIYFVLFLLPFFPSYSSNTSLYTELYTKGFYEIANTFYLKSDYSELYKNFDLFIDTTMSAQNFFTNITKLEDEFLSEDPIALRYCNAPPSFKNPATHTKKITNRIYFQFIKEHYRLIQEKHSYLLAAYPSFQNMLNQLLEIDTLAKHYFREILTSLESQCPGITKIAYSSNEELTIITKIVRYKKTDDWHEHPHFDKSLLTLIWDNDDNHQSLSVSQNPLQPSINSLILPSRKYAHSTTETSTILINGLCLKTTPFNLKPTLHYVGPISQEYRHSIISFLLIPNIDTTHLKTEFIE